MGCDKKLSLLSYNRLCELVEQKVIEGVPLENVNGASIDITLGNRFIFEKAVVDFTRNAQVVLKYRESFEPLEIEIVDEDSVILKPGEFVLAQSREIFNLPRNIAAEYKLKSSLARIGLDHFNAGYCDPGWNNSVLTLELKNCLQYHTIVLTPGDKIGQMIFFECDEVPEQSSYAQRGRYNSDKGVTKIKL
ncbi:MAG TPA: dCTP deaminase [Nitrospira sp.]|jgi:deoxycytidine triphosphate deaminase|nr:dCTP deaminase [Bacteroidia bacterium]HNP40714.1 dCTP deaminase [Nitrospira sp.]